MGECLDVMSSIPESSIDMVMCDLPYGTTNNSWDSVINLESLWMQYWRVLKPNGVVALTAAQPFTSVLVASNLKDFKVEWIWEKTVGSGQLNIKHQPLRVHESVLVFYRRKPTYNPQMTVGEPYAMTRTATAEGPSYGAQRPHVVTNEGVRHPRTVIKVPNPRIKGGHPTQKPVALMEYFILTYSKPGDVVLDNCMGSGTTALAAINTGRDYIGIENHRPYYEMAMSRIASHVPG